MTEVVKHVIRHVGNVAARPSGIQLPHLDISLGRSLQYTLGLSQRALSFWKRNGPGPLGYEIEIAHQVETPTMQLGRHRLDHRLARLEPGALVLALVPGRLEQDARITTRHAEIQIQADRSTATCEMLQVRDELCFYPLWVGSEIVHALQQRISFYTAGQAFRREPQDKSLSSVSGGIPMPLYLHRQRRQIAAKINYLLSET